MGSSYSYGGRERDVGLRLLGRPPPGNFSNALDSIPQRPRHDLDARIQLWRLDTADVVALPEQADENAGFGSFAPNPARRIANLGRRGILQVTQANESGVLGLERKEPRHRERVGLRSTRPNAAPPDQLRERHGDRLVEQADAGNTQDGSVGPPSLGQAGSVLTGGGLDLLEASERAFLLGLGRSLRLVFVGVEIVNDLDDDVADTLHALVIERVAFGVRLRQPQPTHEHGLVVFDQRLLLEKLLGLLDGLDRIARQHALVHLLLRRERWLASQHHLEELQPLNVAAENDEADRQRCRQDEADRTPQPGPERRRGDHRHWGQSAAVAIDQRLDDVADNGLGDEEQRGSPHNHGPARPHRRRQDQRKDRRDDRADIGDKAQDHGQHAPQRRTRHTDQPQADTDHHPEPGIEQQLHQEQAAQALAGFVHGGGGALEVVRAGEAHEAITQILLLHEDEITKMTTMPVVVSGSIKGATSAAKVCSAPGSGWCTSTGIGLSRVDVSPSAGIAGRATPRGRSSSLPKSCSTSEARSSVLLPAAAPRTAWIFSRNVDW